MEEEFDISCYVIEKKHFSTLEIKDSFINDLKRVAIDGLKFEVSDSSILPEQKEHWEIFHNFKLIHNKLNEIFKDDSNEIRIRFLPKEKRYFTINILVPDDDFKLINDSIQLMIYFMKELIKYRDIRNTTIFGSRGDLKMTDITGDIFPNALGWWNWFNNDIVNNIGKEKLLSAPIYKAEEYNDGIIWQLTEKFTDKPNVEILKNLKALLPRDHKLRIVIGMD